MKNILHILSLSCLVLISCTKDDPVGNLEGKIIFSKIGVPYYHIKDLKTGQITSYNALPHVSPSSNKVVMYDYQNILVTDFSGKQIIYSNNPLEIQEIDFLWSPDDEHLAVLKPRESKRLTIFDLDKKISSEIRMPNYVTVTSFIAWLASDNYLYFMSRDDSKNQSYISRMKSDGSEFKHIFTLESDQTFDQAVDFNEPSGLIVFTLFDSLSQESRICKVLTNGTDFETLYAEKTHAKYYFYRFKISPDGKKIVYEDWRYTNSIYLFNIPDKRKLLWSKGLNPHWSSDGLIIMYWWTGGIQVKRLDQPNGNANIVEVGMDNFYSWYFD